MKKKTHQRRPLLETLESKALLSTVAVEVPAGEISALAAKHKKPHKPTKVAELKGTIEGVVALSGGKEFVTADGTVTPLGFVVAHGHGHTADGKLVANVVLASSTGSGSERIHITGPAPTTSKKGVTESYVVLDGTGKFEKAKGQKGTATLVELPATHTKEGVPVGPLFSLKFNEAKVTHHKGTHHPKKKG